VPTVTRLTTKHQITIPAEVRRALGLKSGDQVEFSVEGSTVALRKAEPRVPAVQAHAMRDWDTPEDDEAFRDLWAVGGHLGAVSVHRGARGQAPSGPGRVDG
jgi:antitoxin PrlF